MNRRHFLHGLGGACVAAPFLSSVAERFARAQGLASSTPKRLIVMFTHYGCLTDRWFPENSHGPLATEDLAGTSLEVLGPHVSKLLLPRGIRAMNQWTSTGDLGQGNDPHTQVVGSYFTCVPVTPHTDDPFNFDEETKFLAMPTAPSLDHVCARQLNQSGVPLLLRVGGRFDTAQSAISYSAGEQPFEGLGSASAAFAELTGLFGSGAVSEDTYAVARGKNLIDVVRADLERLEAHDMSGTDRQKLEAWKDLLSDTTPVIRATFCTSETAGELGLTEANLAPPPTPAEEEAPVDVVAGKVTDDRDYADVYSNIAVLSALCDHSRVIVLKYPANHLYRGLDLTVESHSLSHRMLNAAGPTCDARMNDLLQTIDRYHAAKFGHLITELDRFDEGDGTLLDNSAVVWFQELSDGAAHNLNNMPLLQAGSCGGYFKTGVAVNVEDGSADLHPGNSSVVCDPSSAPSGTSTATPEEFGNAPINKYYCNLMNAIGVRAGADGFPQEGGSADVTHYGMYDDTRDFASGGANPPKINSPGGFDELRAGA